MQCYASAACCFNETNTRCLPHIDYVDIKWITPLASCALHTWKHVDKKQLGVWGDTFCYVERITRFCHVLLSQVIRVLPGYQDKLVSWWTGGISKQSALYGSVTTVAFLQDSSSRNSCCLIYWCVGYMHIFLEVAGTLGQKSEIKMYLSNLKGWSLAVESQVSMLLLPATVTKLSADPKH